MADGQPDLDLDDYPGGDESDSGAESKDFVTLRKYARKQEREAKALAAEIETLRAFKAEVEQAKRAETLVSTFKEVGLSEKHAELFAKVNPEAEITADAVKAFANEYSLPTVETQEVPDAPDVQPNGFTPVVTGHGPAIEQVSIDDIDKLRAAGQFAKVEELFAKGLVAEEPAPWK